MEKKTSADRSNLRKINLSKPLQKKTFSSDGRACDVRLEKKDYLKDLDLKNLEPKERDLKEADSEELPWVKAFWFDVPLEMRSKSNFRLGQTDKGTRANWSAFKEFEFDLSLLARQARPKEWELGETGQPLGSRPVVVSFVFARSTLDAANLSKSVLDACEGVVFHNDASVRYCATLGIRTRKDLGGLVSFALLKPTASVKEILEAAWSLEAKALEKLGLD